LKRGFVDEREGKHYSIISTTHPFLSNFPLTNHIILFVVGNVFLACILHGAGLLHLLCSCLFFVFLFLFISNHNLSELNERYEYRIPQNARRARRKSKGVGSLLERGGERRCGKAERERDRERGNETIPYHLGVGSIISIGWFKKGHGSGSKV
jgi:hypothetical protein